MPIEVDRMVCIGSGQCVHLLPGLFDQHDDGTVRLLASQADPAQREAVLDAVAECPVGAILVTE